MKNHMHNGQNNHHGHHLKEGAQLNSHENHTIAHSLIQHAAAMAISHRLVPPFLFSLSLSPFSFQCKENMNSQ